MFSNIKGLKLNKPGENNIIKLDFFDNVEDCACVVYGRNGSGKSSIARAIHRYIEVGHWGEGELLYNHDDSSIELSTEELNRIFIFNEDFIEDNINVDTDSVESIVILGENVKLKLKIDYIDRLLAKREKIKNNIYNKINAYNSNINSIESKIKEKLQNNWAERERRILKHIRKSTVNETLISSIKSYPIEENYNYNIELERFDFNLCHFEALEEDSKKLELISIKLPDIEEEKLYSLLSTHIEKPELNKREQYLLSLVGRVEGFSLEYINSEFSKDQVDECPFCLQPISKSYKEELCENIKRILTKEVEVLKANLQSFALEETNIELSDYVILDKDLTKSLKSQVMELNTKILKLKKYILSKYNNPYETCIFERENICDSIESIKDSIGKLNKKITNYNEQIDNREKTRNLLMTSNKKLAKSEIASYIDLIDSVHDKKERLIKSYNIFDLNLAKLNNEKSDLVAKQASIKIAIDLINKYLQMIFFDNNRLKLEVVDEKYILRVNGKKVEPKNISTGERNIIALCYFFTIIGKNLSLNKRYTLPSLVVIDDPISSFDFDNKLGLISFLIGELQQIIKLSNSKSRIIVLTHDLQVVYDLRTFINKIFKVQYKELTKDGLIKRDYGKEHEYSILLKEVYKFACDLELNEFKVGNSLRRILEFYCSFLYRMGIDGILTSEAILNRVEDTNKREFFKRSVYKLVLNGYSHTQESARRITITEPLYSVDECRKVTRSVLGLMYYLDSEHVLSHLCNGNNEVSREHVKSTITEWIEEYTCETV